MCLPGSKGRYHRHARGRRDVHRPPCSALMALTISLQGVLFTEQVVVLQGIVPNVPTAHKAGKRVSPDLLPFL
jgi:hypothetical protein